MIVKWFLFNKNYCFYFHARTAWLVTDLLPASEPTKPNHRSTTTAVVYGPGPGGHQTNPSQINAPARRHQAFSSDPVNVKLYSDTLRQWSRLQLSFVKHQNWQLDFEHLIQIILKVSGLVKRCLVWKLFKM